MSGSENILRDIFKVPKGFLWHADIPRDINKWKCRLKNWVIFDQERWTNPLEKRRFLDEIQIFFKKFPIESVCLKTSPETFLGHAKDQVQRNSPQRWSQGAI